jgi:predicted DNA-binding transcriptional regulator AlpA
MENGCEGKTGLLGDPLGKGRAPSRQLIDASQLARMLGCSSRTVFRLADGGKIPWGIKLGGLRRWDVVEIEAFLAAGCKMPATSSGTSRGPRRGRARAVARV